MGPLPEKGQLILCYLTNNPLLVASLNDAIPDPLCVPIVNCDNELFVIIGDIIDSTSDKHVLLRLSTLLLHAA